MLCLYLGTTHTHCVQETFTTMADHLATMPILSMALQ
jgi:hypothetical protein